MENNDLNKKVLRRIKEKIAIDEFIQENKNYKPKKKTSFLKVASFAIIATVVTGNIYTYATQNKDIVTYVLDKLEILTKNEESFVQVNETKDGEKATLTLENYGFDEDTMIIGYKLEIKNPEESFVNYLIDNSRIVDGEKIYGLDRCYSMTPSKISDTEYEVIAFYNFDTSLISENAVFETRIYLPKYLDVGEHVGDWTFSIPLTTDKRVLNYEEYELNDKKITLEEHNIEELPENYIRKNLNLLEIKKSDIATKLICYLDGYLTGGISYFIEIIDEDEKVILPDRMQAVPGGIVSEVVFKKIDFDSKITVKITEMDGEEVLAKGSTEIDLRTDLKEKQERKISYETKNWKNLKLKYDKEFDVSTYKNDSTLHDIIKYIIDFRLYEYFGNQKEYTDIIRLTCYKNVENETLENIANFKRTVGIVNYDACYFQKSFPEYVNEKGDFVYLNKEQLLEFAKNREIEVEGYILNSENFGFNDLEYDNIINTKINGNDAISWNVMCGDIKTEYIFLYKGNVYEMSVPNNIASTQIVKDFIDNIEFK